MHRGAHRLLGTGLRLAKPETSAERPRGDRRRPLAYHRFALASVARPDLDHDGVEHQLRPTMQVRAVSSRVRERKTLTRQTNRSDADRRCGDSLHGAWLVGR
jgi:hypothetical protein